MRISMNNEQQNLLQSQLKKEQSKTVQQHTNECQLFSCVISRLAEKNKMIDGVKLVGMIFNLVENRIGLVENT